VFKEIITLPSSGPRPSLQLEVDESHHIVNVKFVFG